MSVPEYDVVLVGGGLAAALLLKELRGVARAGRGRGSLPATDAPERPLELLELRADPL